ncbi:MAG: sulfotransferase domain-containing protein [Maricaulaceae bacterium]
MPEPGRQAPPYDYVFATGLNRSGSTWGYNVARLLLADACGAEAYECGYFGEGDAFEAELDQRVGERRRALMKFHIPSPLAVDLAEHDRARAIFTWRHPLAAIASLMEMFDTPFDDALEWVELGLTAGEIWAETDAVVFVAFDDLTRAPEREIARIAAGLGVSASGQTITRIAEATNFFNAKAHAERLKGRSDLIDAGESAYDPVTLLHVGHAREGAERDWRQTLSADQADRARGHLKTWFAADGTFAPGVLAQTG